MSLPLGIAETWAYRRFILGSVAQELRARYAGSLLGGVWALIQPLTLIVIYSVIFSTIMSPRLPGYDQPFAYTIFLCSGLLLWQFFAELLDRTVGIFVQNGSLLKKVYFPRLTLPFISLFASLLNYLLIMLWFLLLLIVVDSLPGTAVVAVLPVIVIASGFAVGLGLFGATVNVYYRDAGQFTGVVTQFWFWLTPIIYPADILPESFRSYLEWNPIYPLVVAMQQVFLGNLMPVWHTLIYPAVAACLLLILGAVTYFRLGKDMTDEL